MHLTFSNCNIFLKHNSVFNLSCLAEIKAKVTPALQHTQKASVIACISTGHQTFANLL